MNPEVHRVGGDFDIRDLQLGGDKSIENDGVLYVRGDLVRRLFSALVAQVYEHGVVADDAIDIIHELTWIDDDDDEVDG